MRRAGADTLEIELADGPTDDGIDAAALLGALVAAGVPVADFREDVREGDGGLEHLFLQLTAPGASQLRDRVGPVEPVEPLEPVEPAEPVEPRR